MGFDLRKVLRGLLCRLGMHDFKAIDFTFGFGVGGNVETLQCQHCGLKVTQRT
jgi:hypothetical protein